jgi:DNA-binding transcriptional regulator YdaS (Cro superfamily)
MTLTEYFFNKDRGAKVEMAKSLGISKTWLSLILSGRKTPSATLCNQIELLTKGKVKRTELRPDIFMKPANLEKSQ